MELDTVKNLVQNLGKKDFDVVVDTLLRDVYHVRSISVDRPGDGGSDRKALQDSGGASSVAFQVTVQDEDWRVKAIADARKALKELGATRYFFFTSRPRQPGALRQLENDITSELHMPATCLGAWEIAGLLVEQGLLAPLLDALGVPHTVQHAGRPDQEEILLHAYIGFGIETLRLKDTIYDDALQIVLRSSGTGMTRAALVEAAGTHLGDGLFRADQLERRIDSLLSRGRIAKEGDNLSLGANARLEMQLAERVYESEFSQLAAAHSDLLYAISGGQWNADATRRATTLVARLFIKTQLELARQYYSKVSGLPLLREVGDPLQQLRDLLREHSVPSQSIEHAVGRLVDESKDSPLVKKLVAAALFVILEGNNPASTIKALGAQQWSDVTAIVDTSVAIPYLCSRLYAPTSGRASSSSVAGIRRLIDLGVRCTIPFFYINECAWHLLRALEYCSIAHLENELAYSKNGFVSHYFEMRRGGLRCPNTLEDYLMSFSMAIKSRNPDRSAWVRKIMMDLQPLLRRFGVEFEEIPKVPDAYRDEVEREYAFTLNELGRPKEKLLLDNDVMVLAHMKKRVTENGDVRMNLTWDTTNVRVGARVANSGWVITPSEMNELIHVVAPLSELQLTTLSHQIARMHMRPEEVSARILDRVVHHASKRLQNWEFMREMDNFRKDVLSRFDPDNPALENWIDQETDAFLKTHGTDASASPSEAVETDST